MKKLIALTLALLLCLCTLVPASASTTLSFSTFRKNYDTVFTTCLPNSTTEWFTKTIDGQKAWGCRMDGVLPVVMVTVDSNDNVEAIVISFDGELNEEDLNVFIVMCGLAGAALTVTPGSNGRAAFDTAMTQTTSGILNSLENDLPVFTMYGVSCMFDATVNGTECNYFLVIYPNGIK